MARMTASVMVFVGLLASVSATCGDVQSGAFYPNTFLDTPPAYVNGQFLDTSSTEEDFLFTSTTVSFDLFGDTSNNFRVFDTGIVLAGPGPSTTAPDFSTFIVGAVTDTLAFSPYALIAGDFTGSDTAEVEAKLIERANEYSSGNPVGPHICEIEQAEWEVHAWSGVIQEVDGIIIVTWRFSIGGQQVISQLAFIHTTSDETYVTMQYELLSGAVIGSPTYFIANGDYATTGAAKYATVCGDKTTLLGMSNFLCGVPNKVLFSLDAGDACTPATTPTCGSLDPDYNTNNPNCRALTMTQDTCYVEGSCKYKYDGTADSFTFDFLIMEEVAEYDGWEIVDNTGKNRLQPWCTLITANRNMDNDVEIVQDFDPTLISDCGSAMQPVRYFRITVVR